MYKALLVDDEAKLREVLKTKLNTFFPDSIITEESANIVEAEQKIKTFKPHIVYLDIAMPGGTGFDLITKLENIDFEIIFVTGYDEYAIDAIRVSAVDYLLKPLRSEELITATNRAINNIVDHNKLKGYNVLKHNILNVGNQEAKIAIPGGESFDLVSIKDIIRCEGWNKYTRIFLSEKDQIISSYNIGVFKEMLVSYGFFPTHKSHLINVSHIKKYHKQGMVELVDGSQVPIARRRKEEFLNKILPNRVNKN